MATYTYRCRTDGPAEVRRPIGTAPASIPCPTCGASAARVITPPMLGFADPVRMAAIDRADASRTAPAVVSAIPAAPHGRTAPRLDPRTSRLPRP